MAYFNKSIFIACVLLLTLSVRLRAEFSVGGALFSSMIDH